MQELTNGNSDTFTNPIHHQLTETLCVFLQYRPVVWARPSHTILLATLVALPACADIISTNFSGVSGNSNGQTPGERVLTPDAGPWDDLVFNFFDTNGNPYALGDMYLLTSAYTGTPQALSTSTSGFLAVSTAASGQWVFDPAVSIDADSNYYFYMSDNPPTGTVADISGSSAFGSAGGTGNFVSHPFAMQYTLDGTVQDSSAPEPAAITLLLSGLAMISVVKRRRDASGSSS